MSKGQVDREIRRKSREIQRRVGRIVGDLEEKVDTLRTGPKPRVSRVYRYKGAAYMRPCGRGINVRGNANQEPYEALDEQICMAPGITEGDFEIEIVARRAHPWRKRRQ